MIRIVLAEFAIVVLSVLLGAMLAWNFAVYKLGLHIKSGQFMKDGIEYRILPTDNHSITERNREQ